MKGRSKII
jgi:hypothetical protein